MTQPIIDARVSLNDIQRMYYAYQVQNGPYIQQLNQAVADSNATQAMNQTTQIANQQSQLDKLTSILATLNSINGTDGMLHGDIQAVLAAQPLQPNVFKTALVTATGDTAIWTPTTGKKFRLMGYSIEFSSNISIALGALINATLKDGSTAMGMGMSLWAPLASVATGSGYIGTPWRDMKNGYLSSAVNNILYLNMSGALSGGTARVNLMGREE